MAGMTTMMRRAGTGLAATAVAGAAVLGTASAASASPPPIATIHKVACGARTFTVHYEASRKVCLEGLGTLRVSIPDVSRVTTGENTGRFTVRLRGGERVVAFRPGQSIALFGLPSTIVSVTISRF
jgi:hypothetical protein